jgi:hypothetical protein
MGLRRQKAKHSSVQQNSHHKRSEPDEKRYFAMEGELNFELTRTCLQGT